MIKIPATSGSYYIDSGSNGTYHELVAKFVRQFTVLATVYVVANTAKAHVKVG